MAVSRIVGSFNTTTGAAATTVVTAAVVPAVNLTTTPWLLKVWTTGKTTTAGTDGQSEEDIQVSFGFASGTASRACFAAQLDHGNAAGVCHNANYTDAVLASLTIAGALDGKLDIQSANSDGTVTLVVDNNFARNLNVSYELIADSTMSVTIGTITIPTSETTQDIATGFAMNTGLDDKAVIFANGDGFSAIGSIDTWIMACVGVAANDTPFNWSILARSTGDSPATSNTAGNGSSGKCFQAEFGGGPINAAVTSWLATGFRLTWTGSSIGASNHDILYAAIKGPSCRAGEFNVRTDATPFSVTGLTFEPASVLFASAGKTESSTPTGTLTELTDHAYFMVGTVDKALNQRAQSYFDRDASANMDAATAVEHDAFYHRNSTANPSVTDGIGAVTAMNSDGWTMAMSDADSVAAWVGYLAVGPPAAAGTKAPPPRRNRTRWLRRVFDFLFPMGV